MRAAAARTLFTSCRGVGSRCCSLRAVAPRRLSSFIVIVGVLVFLGSRFGFSKSDEGVEGKFSRQVHPPLADVVGEDTYFSSSQKLPHKEADVSQARVAIGLSILVLESVSLDVGVEGEFRRV